MEDQKQTKDPKQLQTLLNSLNVFNRRFQTANRRWRIQNDFTKDQQGNIYVTKERVAYLQEIMTQQYRILVAERRMPQKEIDMHVMQRVVDFLTNPNAKQNLLLFGTTGTGKTTFMKAMYRTILFLYADEINSKEITTMFEKASGLGAILKQDKEWFKRIKACTCLFIDDLGFNGESEVVNDYGVKSRPMDDIIEYRYDNQLMTCCTSNLTEGEIKERYGERIYSRICETFAMIPVTNGGVDFRQQR